MDTRYAGIICLLMAFAFLMGQGCSLKFLYPDLDEELPLTLEAIFFIKALADNGAFSDFGQNVHAPFKTKLPANHSFPLTLQFRTPPAQENIVYWFTLEKKEKDADWEILKIWKSDKHGKMLEDNLALPTPEQQKSANETMKKLLYSQPSPSG